MEAQIAAVRTQAAGKVTGFGLQTHGESQTISRFRGEAHALLEAAETAEHGSPFRASAAANFVAVFQPLQLSFASEPSGCAVETYSPPTC